MSDVKTKAYNLTQEEVYVIAEALQMFLNWHVPAGDYGVLVKMFERLMAEFEFNVTSQVDS